MNHLQKAQEILNQLNGKIIHVMGNHDYRGFWEALQAMNPDKIIGFYDNYETKINRTKIVINHYPHYTFNCSHHGSILLHGHEHGELEAPGRQLDIGFDGSQNKRPNRKYGFWTEDEIMEYMKDVEIFNPRNRKPR